MDAVAINTRFAKRQAFHDDQIAGYRRTPGAITANFAVGHVLLQINRPVRVPCTFGKIEEQSAHMTTRVIVRITRAEAAVANVENKTPIPTLERLGVNARRFAPDAWATIMSSP